MQRSVIVPFSAQSRDQPQAASVRAGACVMAAAPAASPNLFGLTQYDGLTDFFGGDQTFEYNGFILPEVRLGRGHWPWMAR